jgi:hypothetical protein
MVPGEREQDSSPRAVAGLVFQFTQAEWNMAFQKFGLCVGVTDLKPYLYGLRRGGASFDRATQARPALKVDLREGWTTDASARRYEVHGRVAEQLHRRGDEVMARAMGAPARLAPRLARSSRRSAARRIPDGGAARRIPRPRSPGSEEDPEASCSSSRAWTTCAARRQTRAAAKDEAVEKLEGRRHREECPQAKGGASCAEERQARKGWRRRGRELCRQVGGACRGGLPPPSLPAKVSGGTNLGNWPLQVDVLRALGA